LKFEVLFSRSSFGSFLVIAFIAGFDGLRFRGDDVLHSVTELKIAQAVLGATLFRFGGGATRLVINQKHSDTS
jgi:hypothetical protein